jgi:hypothetical protein
MSSSKYKIVEEKNVIDDHLLDIIGNEFKFDHEKGLAEWIKNSVDAYIRSNVPGNEQMVILRFSDKDLQNINFDCIDFNGMTSVDIDKALKRWGDPEAAKRGLQKKVYGGHGNGGKFYMRQMFNKSYFISFKDGLINIFGFNEKRKYGFANNFKNKKASFQEALKIANLKENQIPSKYLEKISKNKAGFTVVRGIGPKGIRKEIKVHRICEKLRRHPQSMRIMERIPVEVRYNSDLLFAELKPEVMKPHKNFEEPIIYTLPKEVVEKGKSILLANNKYPAGKLTLRTSEIALNGRFVDLNRIDIIGELGVIASYPLRELGLYYPQTDFVYGECECPILEDSEEDYVKNDRTKLSDGEKSLALLDLIREQIKILCEEMSEKEEKERQDISKKISSDFNNFLDQWKNKFMNKIFSEIFVGPGEGSGGGSGVGGSLGKFGSGKGNKGKSGGGQGEGDGGGDTSKKGSRFPKVLLSSYDDDPLNTGNKLILQPEQGLVYQRVQDVKEGIYWINTSSPLADAILDKYGANSLRFRDYLFQRYVDIFIKESLIRLEKKEPERFNAATIDGEILGKIVTRIHDAAASDLTRFLFDEHYEVKNGESQ